MAIAPPRYRRLADTLIEAIAAGAWPVGGQLPPEMELCRTHGVSRHTVREAIRLVAAAGLIERRRGAGTTIVATTPPSAYVQPLGGVDDLLQYAHDARLRVRSLEERRLTAREAERIGADETRSWLVVDGLRIVGTLPLALSTIYVAPPYAEVAALIDGSDRPILSLLDERFGVAAGRIDQEITAELLDAASAAVLKAEPNGAALRTLRRYHGADDALILASDSLHPGGRFVYAMTYRPGV